ncbi:MAG: ABC transporter permease [Nanoarchaeota archaeon]|nr:ABC transporter permease [Nanoarchaeota archaeon]
MKKIYIIWLRELKKYSRSKSRIIGSLGMPTLFLVVLGFGLNPLLDVENGNYLNFIFPGILAMTVLFTSMFSGISVIWDKQFGFMKEMLVAPVSRTKIMIGKTLGGATTAVFQGFLIFFISLLIGVRIHSLAGFFIALAFMILIGIAFTALGLAFASRMEDMQAFPLVMNFVLMPLFFLSGALFPLDSAPKILKIIALFNPLTYGVDALRFGLVGISQMPLWIDFVVMAGFAILTISVGAFLFNRMNV